MPVSNTTQNTTLAVTHTLANTSATRMKGLLHLKSFPDGDALVIEPCSSVHMFFMHFAIDVVFLSKEKTIVGLCNNLKPWQLSPIFWKAHYAIELPTGKIQQTKTQLGDIINF